MSILPKGVLLIYELLLSPARLATYRGVSQSEEEAIARYYWNSHLAGSLLPVVGLLEVVLRNSLVKAFDHTSPQWLTLQWAGWADYKSKPSVGTSVRENPERETLVAAMRRWGTHRDAMIADIALGFWTGLFKRHYKSHLWAKKGVINMVFPDLNLKTPDIVSEMSRRLWRFRHLRNRICHHEPIFNWPGRQKIERQDLLSAYNEALDLLGWLSSKCREDIERYNEFLVVWNAGWQSFR